MKKNHPPNTTTIAIIRIGSERKKRQSKKNLFFFQSLFFSSSPSPSLHACMYTYTLCHSSLLLCFFWNLFIYFANSFHRDA